jgi:hypothetical protein
MTDAVLHFLRRSGWQVEARDLENERLIAYRKNFYFPELLFNLGLTGHREERFLLKIESQDQQILYERTMVNIKGCGFYFPFPVPSDGILCSMKLSALLSRSKGRDFYDAMFLLAQARPDFSFLAEKHGIHDMTELKAAIADILKNIDLNVKKRDFEHLLFNKTNSRRILAFGDFINELE